MKKVACLLLTTFVSFQSFAESLYDKKIEDTRLYDIFVKQGVPEPALQRAFEFMDLNAGRTVKVKAKIRGAQRTYMGARDVTIKSETLAIIDFSKPSSERRLFVMNLRDGKMTKHFVAHGKGSGVNIASKFSNIEGSKMSSLGFYLGGNTYYGGHGESLNLYGLEASNSRAAERDIVVHAASYVSEDFVKSQGRLGRSWGCPAVAPGIIKKMLTNFKEGGVIYAYHADLTAAASSSPSIQEIEVEKDEVDIDLPEEEESVRKSGGGEGTQASAPLATQGMNPAAITNSVTAPATAEQQ